MKGAWRLETADDPLHKLEHDFERMRTSPGDTCARRLIFSLRAEQLSNWTTPQCVGSTACGPHNMIEARVDKMHSRDPRGTPQPVRPPPIRSGDSSIRTTCRPI
jgi:hypothetical protein